MKVFEFHFNPKSQEDLIFESFCYDPGNIYERRLGNLYMSGFLTNALPQNAGFLNNLAKVIKDRYYKNTSTKPEKALRESLRKANEFLEKIAKQGDVTWLGNLNFAVANFKNFELNFTKVGDLKFYLLRKGHVIDIDQKLKFEEIEPYPLKIFGNVVSGKLTENDMVLILTKEIAQAFLREKIIGSLAQALLSEQKNQAKKIKDVINAKREQLLEVKGICLLISLTKEELGKERETLGPSKSLGKFSFKKIFLPIIKKFRMPKISLKKPAPKAKSKVSRVPKLKLSIPNIAFPKLNLKLFTPDRKIIWVVFLILVLILGFFLFQGQKTKQLINYQNQLNVINEKVNQAETYLALIGKDSRAEKTANSLLMESWGEISPLVSIISSFPSDFAGNVSEIKNKISQGLYQLNKVTEITDPKLILEFKPRDFVPQKIASLGENLYLFTPYAENVFTINKNGEGKTLPINKKMSLAAPLSNSVLFFSEPDQLINLIDGKFSEPVSLKVPYQEFSFNDFSSYQSSIYFLDSKNGKITKYPYSSDFQLGLPQTWLENQKAKDYKSMAVDGSVWLLSKNNSIDKYYSGKIQNNFILKIFPEPKEFSQIFTSFQLSYVYILEPSQKRIIIMDKSGQIIRQFQSQKFNNLLDFTVSEESRKIWLLNGLKVFEINF
jgi:hypothetical protein